MRWLVVALAIAAATPAHADSGYFITEALGGGGYQGELARYGDGAPRFHIGIAARRGSWTVEAFGSFSVPDAFAIDCYGVECAYAARPVAGFTAVGADVRRRWRVLSVRRWGKPGVYERPGLFLALHGGPRWFVGDHALAGYRGPGVGGGATVEADLWVIGYFLDFGLDVMRLGPPDDSVPRTAVQGSTPYVMFGAKIGWL